MNTHLPKFARFSKTALLSFLGVWVLVVLMVGNISAWAARGTIVVFNANWCASCREVLPIVRDIASQNQIGVVTIDVDFQDAPRQARSYGLTVPAEEPPQVFYVDKGKATLIFSGKGVKYGATDTVRATILQNLQRVLQ